MISKLYEVILKGLLSMLRTSENEIGGKNESKTNFKEFLTKSQEIDTSKMQTLTLIKVPINPKFIFRLNKSFYNSEQNGANKLVFGQNQNFL